MTIIVDCHTHIGFDHSVDQLLKSMDDARIDKSLVFAGQIAGITNEFLLKAIAPHKDRLFGVAAAHPMQRGALHQFEETKKLVDWFGEGKIVATKFYVGYEYYYPVNADHYLVRLNEVKCPVIFHSGDCYCKNSNTAKLKYAHPLHIDEVAVDYPDINFVIAHMGNPWIVDAAQVCYKNKNVYSDISGFVYGEFSTIDITNFDAAVETFCNITGGIDKLLFGSDWPISNQSSYRSAGGRCESALYQNYSKVFKL